MAMRMDKTVFKIQSVEEAADHQSYYRKLSKEKQAEVFNALMAAAYGFTGKPWPRMDKSHFEIRQHS